MGGVDGLILIVLVALLVVQIVWGLPQVWMLPLNRQPASLPLFVAWLLQWQLREHLIRRRPQCILFQYFQPGQAGLQVPLPDSSGVERKWLAEGTGGIGREQSVHPTALTVGTGVAERQESPTPEKALDSWR